MTSPTSARKACHLCECVLDEKEIREHLRFVHEVMPGERTVADVPAGRVNWLSVASSSERHEHLLAAVAG